GSAPGKSVAIGEIPIAIGYAHDQVKLKVEGAPVVINAPSEGTGYELASMSLIKGGKDAVNAKKLYDWVLSSKSESFFALAKKLYDWVLSSKSAQDLFVQWYLVLVATGAPSHPDALSIKQIKTVKQDLLWDGNKDNRARLLKRWTDEIGSKR
ncbi:MAG TPA: hypothetical protein P5313_13350, partial [Spirochaetia bacterium]|nr:hypothetical protein [Spirochaetia bacterium]